MVIINNQIKDNSQSSSLIRTAAGRNQLLGGKRFGFGFVKMVAAS